MLYSFKGLRPAPLPFRIALTNGFTRTDPATFTAEEIASAGYTGPFTEPSYNPETEFLEWVNGSYIKRDLPPPVPQPNWTLFGVTLIANQDLKSVLASALPVEATAALALPATLLSVSQGGDPTIFFGAWDRLVEGNLISQPLLTSIVNLAEQCNLPTEFTERLNFPFV